MKLDLENKIAIVTGGGEGLGKAIALGLVLEGAKVAISGRTCELYYWYECSRGRWSESRALMDISSPKNISNKSMLVPS